MEINEIVTYLIYGLGFLLFIVILSLTIFNIKCEKCGSNNLDFYSTSDNKEIKDYHKCLDCNEETLVNASKNNIKENNEK